MDKGTIRFFNAPATPDIRLVAGAGVTHEFPRHAHGSFCIGMVRKGVRLVDLAGATVAAPPNTLFVINPETAHTCRPADGKGYDYLAVCVPAPRMAALAGQIAGRSAGSPYFRDTVIPDPDLALRMNGLFSLPQGPDAPLARECRALSLLSDLMTRHGEIQLPPVTATAHRRAIDGVCDYIRDHLDRSLSLDELSAAAGLSPCYFQRVFREHKGASPLEYLMRARIDRACALLGQGRSLAEVAVETGFADQSHFTRFFRRLVGETPGKYRQLHA